MNLRRFDFSDLAEVFVAGKARHGRKSMVYRRFETAARAIQYVMEELAPAKRIATTMEVDGEQYRHTDIRKLYESGAYPLKRAGGEDGTLAPTKSKASAAGATRQRMGR